MIKKYIGNKAFYKTALAVAMPMMIQNAITNFVSLLDNIMVGRLGTVEMSGVSIVNQLLFVFNLCIFGAVAGPGIFTAQFAGSGDNDGVRHTFRFKLIICLIISALGVGVLSTFGEPLIGLYLNGEGSAAEIAATLTNAKAYLKIMVIGFIPFAISNAYAGTMRETGQTVVPMASGIAAVGVNLSLNYVLIFGKLGAPALGVQGAAIATVISRFAELLINAIWLHTHRKRYPYIKGAFRSLKIPKKLAGSICIKGLPLLVNEALWSLGMATLSQCYSTRGITVVAATNISNTIWNLFSVSFLSLGNAVGIIIGQMLGAGKTNDEVRDTNRKLIAFSVVSCVIFGSVMAAFSGLFPQIYNTTPEVRLMATRLICISAVIMPFNAYTNSAYFTLRSGGKTVITFIFDSCFVWIICVPIAFCLSRFTQMPILLLYTVTQGIEILKSALGGYMLKRGDWLQNLTL